MNKTTNYQLNQWERTDRVRMEDFNADNAKIDAAIRAVADSKADLSALTALTARVGVLEGLTFNRITHGSYEGNSSHEPRAIPLPWEPKLVILMGKVNDNAAIALITPDTCIYVSGSSCTFIAGSLYGPSVEGNTLTLRYWFNIGPSHYIAFR